MARLVFQLINCFIAVTNHLQVPGEAEWTAMAALARSSAQTRFLVGVPLGSHNPRLVQHITNKAKRSLGGALLGIELGNEPMYWDCPGMVGAPWLSDGWMPMSRR